VGVKKIKIVDMKLFLPDTIDIDQLLLEKPSTGIKKFKRDHLIYIMHLILAIPAANKDLAMGSCFVPIHARTLQGKVKNYLEYIDYLLEQGIIERDNQYIPGVKSIGYRFNRYFTGIREIELTDKRFAKKLEQEDKLPKPVEPGYRHLVKWYNSNLKINYEAAMAFISADFYRKRRNSDLVEWTKSNVMKDPRQQFISAQLNIKKIVAANFSISVDSRVFRLHSVLTNIRSELRNCLSYDGQELVSIDICNCQPFLSSILLTPTFWSSSSSSSSSFIDRSESSLIRLIDINNSYSTSSTTSPFIMISKFYNILNNSDIHKYRELVQTGCFYEYFEEKAMQVVGRSLTRKEIKAAVFQVLFTDNRFIGQEKAALKRIFKSLFPSVYQIFAEIKKEDKATLPLLLQRIESHLILKEITKRIAKEEPELPIFTIHDSIITTLGKENYVSQVIQDEMEKRIGSRPAVSIENWRIENLQFKDGAKFNTAGPSEKVRQMINKYSKLNLSA
jgi:hypothetical protein